MPLPSHEETRAAAIDDLLTARHGKWTASVMLHLRGETLRFTELQREIGGISQKALTATLRTLERDGFITRTSYATIPPRVDYALTDLGNDVLKVFEAFEQFAARHWHQVVASRRAFDESLGQPPAVLLRASGE